MTFLILFDSSPEGGCGKQVCLKIIKNYNVSVKSILFVGRPRHRWEDNIRMDLEDIGVNAGNWVDSAQDRNYWRALVNAALNLQVP